MRRVAFALLGGAAIAAVVAVSVARPATVSTALPPDPEPTLERQVGAVQRARLGAAYEQLDVDGDGRVSLQEYTPDGSLAARFAERDLDADGFIDAAERRDWQRDNGQASERFKRWSQVGIAVHDQDGDDALSAAEFPGPPEAFGRLDRDGDGRLTRQELHRRSGGEGGDGQRAEPVEGGEVGVDGQALD